MSTTLSSPSGGEGGPAATLVTAVATDPLAECQRQLALMREVAGVVIYVFDLDSGRVSWMNRHLASLVGYDADEIMGFGEDAMATLLHPEDLARTPAIIARWHHASDGDVLEVEFRIRHKQGTWRHFLQRASLFERHPDGRPRRTLCTAIDITERKELEQQLLRSEKLEALGRMAGGIAHDFNNLLTIVLGNVALARAALEQGTDPGHHLDEIGRAAEQASTISRNLLGFARMQAAEPQVVDPNGVLREHEGQLARLAGVESSGATRLSLELGDTWRVRIDPGQLVQILSGLVQNAREAGGRVTVRTGRMRIEATSGGLTPGRWVRLSVVDDGAGMSPETLARAFDPFYSTKREGRGMGLGLPMIYGMVRQNHGLIDLWSEPGRGTRVDLCFPAHEAPEASLTRPVPSKPATGALVVVAEDEPMVAELTRRILTHAGHRVVLARDGLAALEAIRGLKDEVALVISDIVMPRMSGLDLAKALAAEVPGLPVLLASGYPEDERRFNDEVLAKTPFIPKPFRATDLLQAVAQLLTAHAHRQGALLTSP